MLGGAAAIERAFMAIMFAYWLYSTPDPRKKEPFNDSYAASPEAAVAAGEMLAFEWAIWPFEAVMAILILSMLLVEVVQCFVHRWGYFKDFW